MEDARFVRFVDDDGDVTYYATYTAFDGHQILPHLLETADFTSFRVTTTERGGGTEQGHRIFPAADRRQVRGARAGTTTSTTS